VEEHPAEKNLPWLVLRAANRTQTKGSTVRLIAPRAPEGAEELGMEITDARLLAVQEHLQLHGYVEPADIGLAWGAYTITQAGLRSLEEARSGLQEPPTETPESVVSKQTAAAETQAGTPPPDGHREPLVALLALS
jgi:hypothetical protein